ncbi:hypothetical protein BX600DRAFT_463737 [Xylariales sp. PMI_506]|nr:hypothetical protein BX600DRAFT_463737 [Xylariales sp. PMI_506]
MFPLRVSLCVCVCTCTPRVGLSITMGRNWCKIMASTCSVGTLERNFPLRARLGGSVSRCPKRWLPDSEICRVPIIYQAECLARPPN